jgi:hypothetical protein
MSKLNMCTRYDVPTTRAHLSCGHQDVSRDESDVKGHIAACIALQSCQAYPQHTTLSRMTSMAAFRGHLRLDCAVFLVWVALCSSHTFSTGAAAQPLIDAPTAGFSLGCDRNIVSQSITDLCLCVKLITSVLHNGKVPSADIASNTGLSVIEDGGGRGCYGCFNGTAGGLDAGLTEAAGVDPICEAATGDVLRPFASPLTTTNAIAGVPAVFNYRCASCCV